jgi:hypothetical protein
MTTTCPEPLSSNLGSRTAPEALAVLAARAACALEKSIQRLVLASDQNLGHLELQAAQDVQELHRQSLQRGAQAKADATSPLCQVCGQKLSRLSGGHLRSFSTRFGSITVQRTRGYCKRCRKWRVPADAALGLEETAGYSPAVQDMAALLASEMPVQDASAVLEHLTGVKLPRATLDREARRQGQLAQELRRQPDQQASSEKQQLELTLEPYQMILQLDAWDICERDAWGQSEALREQGQEPDRWHWVSTGTCFRLDHRGQSAGGRPVITERGFLATGAGIEGLREQLHAEALRRGLGQAASALVIGDGAVWIWRLADDRWHQARQRLDFYHAVQHLAAVGRAFFGEDKAKLTTWLKPLVRELKNQSSLKVIRRLEEALAAMPRGAAAHAVAKELGYFHEHQGRMDYQAGGRAGEPIGSGAVEATCRQAQCRSKRPGEFWSQAGDEALMCLETFWVMVAGTYSSLTRLSTLHEIEMRPASA